MKIVDIAADQLHLLEDNPRRDLSPEELDQLQGSIKTYGLFKPILVWKDPEGAYQVIGGNQRVRAVRALNAAGRLPLRVELDSGEVVTVTADMPCVEFKGSRSEARGIAVRDNTHEGDWDWAALTEFVKTFEDDLIDVDSPEWGQVTGLDEEELNKLFAEPAADPGLGDRYTHKVESPVYTPKGDKPATSDLVDTTKADQLLADIETSSVPDEVKAFLRQAATRHIVFDFEQIAEFYAHADADTQALMEQSALVIIDFNKAIENGFVKLTKRLQALADQAVTDAAQ